MSAAAAACLVVGLFFNTVGVLGILRFPDVYTRLHADTKATTFGSIFIALAAVLAAAREAFAAGAGGWGAWANVAVHIGFAVVVLLVTNATGGHAIARAAWRAGHRPAQAVCDALAAAGAPKLEEVPAPEDETPSPEDETPSPEDETPSPEDETIAETEASGVQPAEPEGEPALTAEPESEPSQPADAAEPPATPAAPEAPVEPVPPVAPEAPAAPETPAVRNVPETPAAPPPAATPAALQEGGAEA